MKNEIDLLEVFLVVGIDVIVSFLIILVKAVLVLAVLILSVAFSTLLERRLLAFFQERYGPCKVGWKGILQPIADGLKLLFKEDVVVHRADKLTYIAAPMIAVFSSLAPFSVIPFGNYLLPAQLQIGNILIDLSWGSANKAVVADVEAGILVVLCFSALTVFSFMFAGKGSGNKYAVISAVRASAILLSYEVVKSFAIISVVISVGSLSLAEIVNAQKGYWFGFIPKWFCFSQPLSFILFVVIIFAETNRTPFDFIECENELVAGYMMEYSSMKFAMFYLSEYAHLLISSACLVTLFFGGWQGPFINGQIIDYILPIFYFSIKTFLVVFLFIWVRASLPRYRYDLLIKNCWKYLIPISLFNIMLSTFFVI